MQAAFSKYINSSETLKALHARSPGLIRSSFTAAVTALAAEWEKIPFLHIQMTPKAPKWLWHAGLIWNAVYRGEQHTPASGAEKLKTLAAAGKQPWRLATAQKLVSFAWNNACPWRAGKNGRLFEQWNYVSASGGLDLDDNNTNTNHSSGFLLAVTDSFQGDIAALVCHAYLNNWSVFKVGDTSNTDLLKPLKTGAAVNLSTPYRTIDTHSAKLPPLEAADFTDPNKGLWELWGLDPKALEALGLRARNPADDVQQGMVAIDFGTSSTVVDNYCASALPISGKHPNPRITKTPRCWS